MQVLLVNTSEGPQVRTKRGTRSLAGVAVDFASAITIIIPRPFMDTMADRSMDGMTAPVALPFVGVEQGAAPRNVLRDQRRAGVCIGMVTDPPTLLPRLTRDATDDGRTIIRIGPVPFPLIGAPPGRIGGVSVRGAFFPPRCSTAHRLRRRYPS